MVSRRVERGFAFVLSIGVHAAIVVALTFSVSLGGTRPPQQVVIPIDTVMIDESAVRAEMARLEAEEQERIRAQEAEQQRQREEAERLRREQEAEQQRLADLEQQRVEAEQQRIREAEEAEVRAAEERERLRILEERRIEEERVEQERLEAERREQERIAEERRREEARLEAERQARIAEIEEQTRRAVAAEQEARAAADAGLREQWSRAISARVTRYWLRPPNVQVGLECLIYVTQLPNGDVRNVEVDECNTIDQNIIRSIENAVLNASPLPPPPRGVQFESVVRIRFIPEE